MVTDVPSKLQWWWQEVFSHFMSHLNAQYFRSFSTLPAWGHGVAFWEGMLVGRYKRKERLCHRMTLLVVYQWRMMICSSSMTLTVPPASSEEHFNLLPFGKKVGIWGQHGVCVCPSWLIVMKSWYERYVTLINCTVFIQMLDESKMTLPKNMSAKGKCFYPNLRWPP